MELCGPSWRYFPLTSTAGGSNQSEVAQAGMVAAADDQMVMYGHAERLGGLDDVFGHGDVRLGGGRVSRRMIVHQDQCGCPELERAFAYFTGVDWRVIDSPALLPLVPDQDILAVEEKDVDSSTLPCAICAVQ